MSTSTVSGAAGPDFPGANPTGSNGAIRITSPWLDVGGWVLDYRDRAGLAHRLEWRSVNGSPSPPMSLPDTFRGTIELRDRHSAGIGRLSIEKRGPGAGLEVRSVDLDVRVLGGHELLIQRATRPVRCYLRLPRELGAATLWLSDRGVESSRKLASPMGESFELPAGFQGSIVVRSASGESMLTLRLHPTGRGHGVESRAVSGYGVQVRGNGSMLDITVSAGRLPTRIR